MTATQPDLDALAQVAQEIAAEYGTLLPLVAAGPSPAVVTARCHRCGKPIDTPSSGTFMFPLQHSDCEQRPTLAQAITSAIQRAHAAGRADAEAMFRASAADDARRLAEIREWLVTPGTITARAPRGADDREADVEMLLRLLDATAGVREAMWRPIETAPKDGTDVMLWLRAPYSAAVIRRWSHADDAWVCGDNNWFTGRNVPTHWMLPTPPQRTDEKPPEDKEGASDGSSTTA